MFNKLITTMLFSALILCFIVSASVIAAADASPSVCQPGSGTPGGWYWCFGKDFNDLGSEFGCDWWPETNSCFSFKYLKNVRHSIGPDYGGYCKFFLDLECNGPVMDIHTDGNVKDRLDCPGTGNMAGIEGHSMKCFKY